MFFKDLLTGLFMMLILSSSAYAAESDVNWQKVQLTTFFPLAYAEYTNLKSTNDAYFATTQGNVGIGTGATAPAYKLEVKGMIVNSNPSQGYLALSGHLAGFANDVKPTLKTNGDYIYFDAGGTYTGYIGYSTGIQPYPSDAKLKTNIATVGNALDKISQIRGVTFAWKDGRDNYARHMGVLAQDVEKVAPELVSQPPGIGVKGVVYGGLTALTIEAIKEQQKELNEQQRLIDLLKKEIEELKKLKRLKEKNAKA